jgi:hypothetical protein
MAHNRDTTALEELITVANLEEERVLAIWAEEQKSGLMNPRLDTMIRIQKELLLSVQEIFFDVGLDDYKRHTPSDHIVAVETRRAEQEARAAEAVREMEEIFEKHVGKWPQADAHLKERTTNAKTCPPADVNETDSRAERLAAVSCEDAVQGASVGEKLVKLANIQSQRVLALLAEENKSGFINPALDSVIRLHRELLVSIQALSIDLGLEQYKRRTPREQVADYWEQERRNEESVYEAITVTNKILSQHFDNLPGGKVPDHNDVDK